MASAPFGVAVMPNIDRLALDLLRTNPVASALPHLADKKIGWFRGEQLRKTTLPQPLRSGDSALSD